MADSCIWTQAASHIRIPSTEDKIFKDECIFSFETPDLADGVFICMRSFLAIGPKLVKKYATVTGCSVFLQYKIKREFKKRDQNVDPRPTKLALGVPGGFELPQDRYSVSEQWTLFLIPQGQKLVLPNPIGPTVSAADTTRLMDLGLPENLAKAIIMVQLAESALLVEERASTVAAWEEENMRPVSAHAMNLEQLDNGIRISPSGWKCCACDLKENLWLNLTDGSINCGRRFWDGSGGNNHAVEHYQRTKYPLAVKLGTITPEGAEVFSYAEDEMVTDPLLAEHLAHFGIDVLRMQKTDKTVAELEISANERIGEWQLLQESNRELEPRYGPGMTGLRNLGNTCYMNAVVQVLFAIPHFRWLFAYRLPYWIDRALNEWRSPSGESLPIDHVGLQFAKLGHGLCSGAYSWRCPDNLDEIAEGPVPILPGIRPQLFRRLIGRNNVTFSTKHQQDAYEFLIYLLDLLDSKASVESCDSNTVQTAHGENRTVPYPSSCLRFSVEDRLECGLTHKVRYATRDEFVLSLPVPIEAMVNKAEYEAYEKHRQQNATARVSLPTEEVVRPRIPFEACLSAWGEVEKVNDFATPASDPPGARTYALRSSRLLNFPDYLCVQLAKYTIGSDWLPQKLDVEIELPSSEKKEEFRVDLAGLRSRGGLQPNEVLMPDLDAKITNVHSTQPISVEPNIEYVSHLVSMGFTNLASCKACILTNNVSLETALEWIMEHLNDPTLNDPFTEQQRADSLSAQTPANEDSIAMLNAMGLTRAQAVKALNHTGHNLEAAADWAFTNPDVLNDVQEPPNLTNSSGMTTPTSANRCRVQQHSESSNTSTTSSVYELCAFISHMGKATTDGHYVAHIKRSALAKCIPNETPVHHSGSPCCGGTDDEWIIFNDEKVAKSESPPHRLAYVYVFRRVDAPID